MNSMRGSSRYHYPADAARPRRRGDRVNDASSDQAAKDFKCSGRATRLRSYPRAEPPVPPDRSRANACFVHSYAPRLPATDANGVLAL